MANLHKIFYFVLFFGILMPCIQQQLHAQDKKEQKALEKKQKVKNKEKERYDSLMYHNYDMQHKHVKKRIKKSYKQARRNHEGKKAPWYERIWKRRQKKSRSKKRRKK